MFTQYVYFHNLSASMRSCTNTPCSYIGDKKATEAAFDEDGFYRTGDIAQRVGDQYFFQGRAYSDCKCLAMILSTHS